MFLHSRIPSKAVMSHIRSDLSFFQKKAIENEFHISDAKPEALKQAFYYRVFDNDLSLKHTTGSIIQTKAHKICRNS